MDTLKPIHRLIARSVALEGADPSKLQDMTGFTKVYISRLVHDPMFIAEVDRLISKAEEHAIIRKQKALEIVYTDLENLLREQVRLGKEAKSESIRSQAIDRIMSYVYRKKDLQKDEQNKTQYIGIQVHPREGIEKDGDVVPQNIIDFGEAVNDD